MKRNAIVVLALISVLLLTAAAQADDDKRARPPALRIGFSEGYSPLAGFRLSQNFSKMRTYLQNEFGATVTAESAAWSAGMLNQYDIFIIPARYQSATPASATTALRNWVSAGGCLIVLWHPLKKFGSTYPDQVWEGNGLIDNVLNYFGTGMRSTPNGGLDMTSFVGPFNNTPYNVYRVVGNLRTGWVGRTDSGAIPLAWSTSGQMASSYNPNAGSGMLFLIGSVYAFQNAYIDQHENTNFLFNIVHYFNSGNGGGGDPDLYVKKLKGKPTTVTVGQQLKIKARIKNKGGSASTATTVNFYLSPDATYDATDILLGSETVPALNKNKSKKIKKTVIIPSVGAGTYYIIAIVDPGDTVTESDETNNTKVATKVITII